MALRPFGAKGIPPGTMARRGDRPHPILGVPGIPGGTIMNPVQGGGVGLNGSYPKHSGTGSIVSREAVLGWAASASRGTGHAHSRGPEALIHAGTRTPGVHSNLHLVAALAGVDIRNPAIARHLLPSGMTAGSTRIR